MINPAIEKEIGLEENALVFLSRLHIADEDQKRIQELLPRVDIERLFSLSVKHKVLPLLAKHIIDLDIHSQIKPQFKRIFNFYLIGNKHRNAKLLEYCYMIVDELRKNGIKAVPLKGSILIPQVYQDLAIRAMNDLDFLIRTKDRSKTSKILKEMGFKTGFYDWSTDAIIQISYKMELMWKMHAGNLYPHVMKVDDPYLKFVTLDFSYDVDLQQNYIASNGMWESTVSAEMLGHQLECLSPIDFLLHLCVHLFKEATNVQWILAHQDLNLIKFCDIREYILANLTNIAWEQVPKRAKELGCQEALFYSLYYLTFLYGEMPVVNQIMNDLGISDASFLEKYGANDYEASKQWKKSFLERFFSYSNEDEIEEETSYQQFQKELIGRRYI